MLNDNNWHTVRFSRRASNLRLQVDGSAPVRGTLCMYQLHITFFALLRGVTYRTKDKETVTKEIPKRTNEFNEESYPNEVQ